MSEIWKNIYYFSSIIVLTEILFQIKEYFDRRKVKSNEKSDEIAMGLFFPDFALCCPFVFRDNYHSKPLCFETVERHCGSKDCKFKHFSSDQRMVSPFKKLCRVLCSAQKSIDICLWVFSLQPLARLCVYLHSKNIVVRVVIDSREDETENTQISYLRDHGIPVRYAPQMVNSGMFHHKFAIVDSSVLLFGSMNWTLSGVRKNMENICVTSRPQLVGPYVQRFQEYWHNFSAQPTNKRRIVVINNQNSVKTD